MHKNALLRLTVTVGLVGLGAFMGCSSSTTTNGGGATSTTTDTATTSTTGTTTTTNSTSTSTSTTGTTSTGNGGSGQGGSGGAGQGGSGVGGAPDCHGALNWNLKSCGTCMENSCCAEISACLGDADCSSCLQDGQTGCDNAASLLNNITDCQKSNCTSDCTPPAPPVACDAPVDLANAPSKGACVTVKAGTAYGCNPVTNEGCDGAKGEACDLGADANGNSAYQCFPDGNTEAICKTCDNQGGPFCAAGLHCDTSACARYCCDDSDCGAGNTCVKEFPQGVEAVGVCRRPDADAGAADAGK
jgi:hypothetical protein